MSDKASMVAKTPLKTDLLHFYDDFVEFHDYCAFMCDAFAGLSTEEISLDYSTAMGINRFCSWMKCRVKELKGDLREIHEKAHTEC